MEVSNTHGKSDAWSRMAASEIGTPETESVTNPRTRPSGPEPVTTADATMKAAIANATKAIQRETRRWSVGGADMANTPGQGPRQRRGRVRVS